MLYQYFITLIALIGYATTFGVVETEVGEVGSPHGGSSWNVITCCCNRGLVNYYDCDMPLLKNQCSLLKYEVSCSYASRPVPTLPGCPTDFQIKAFNMCPKPPCGTCESWCYRKQDGTYRDPPCSWPACNGCHECC